MIQKKTKTVIIERKNREGKVIAKITYAKVADRLGEFLKANANATISTKCEFKEDFVIFVATVIPDHTTPSRYFTGTSLGKIGFDKALEKIETLAVGRALAFGGYLADGEIASAEEMQKYEETTVPVDVDVAVLKITSSTNLDELKKNWASLSADERANKEIIKVKEEMKKEYEGI